MKKISFSEVFHEWNEKDFIFRSIYAWNEKDFIFLGIYEGNEKDFIFLDIYDWNEKDLIFLSIYEWNEKDFIFLGILFWKISFGSFLASFRVPGKPLWPKGVSNEIFIDFSSTLGALKWYNFRYFFQFTVNPPAVK